MSKKEVGSKVAADTIILALNQYTKAVERNNDLLEKLLGTLDKWILTQTFKPASEVKPEVARATPSEPAKDRILPPNDPWKDGKYSDYYCLKGELQEKCPEMAKAIDECSPGKLVSGGFEFQTKPEWKSYSANRKGAKR